MSLRAKRGNLSLPYEAYHFVASLLAMTINQTLLSAFASKYKATQT